MGVGVKYRFAPSCCPGLDPRATIAHPSRTHTHPNRSRNAGRDRKARPHRGACDGRWQCNAICRLRAVARRREPGGPAGALGHRGAARGGRAWRGLGVGGAACMQHSGCHAARHVPQHRVCSRNSQRLPCREVTWERGESCGPVRCTASASRRIIPRPGCWSLPELQQLPHRSLAPSCAVQRAPPNSSCAHAGRPGQPAQRGGQGGCGWAARICARAMPGLGASWPQLGTAVPAAVSAPGSHHTHAAYAAADDPAHSLDCCPRCARRGRTRTGAPPPPRTCPPSTSVSEPQGRWTWQRCCCHHMQPLHACFGPSVSLSRLQRQPCWACHHLTSYLLLPPATTGPPLLQ
jgi:hypothetical protein